MRTSLFDLFKIGIGPSSSHTVGPMRAAYGFVQALKAQNTLADARRVCVELYGSLALTGRGHATDRAVLLGLSGEQPDTVDPDSIGPLISAIRETRSVLLAGDRKVAFDESQDLLYHRDLVLSGHPNALRFTAFDAQGQQLLAKVYYSIGGGFIRAEDETPAENQTSPVPYPFSTGGELLDQCRRTSLPLWEVVLRNELTWRAESQIRSGIGRIWEVMDSCIERGLQAQGTLPGGLNVKRRAHSLYQRLCHSPSSDPLAQMDWLNAFAMAVNEENACGGRVVTAPTNGAAGVLPAVARYYLQFLNGDQEGLQRFFLSATAIGVLYKENASISGAEVGCQGEVGVACSMAAAGLAAAQHATDAAIEHAAEIGMEHNLGLTCDPIGGLVQVPCIERNAFGAVKAVNAARMALHDDGTHKVSLDQVIHTMYQTGLDMQSKYKETALGGLALNVVEC